MLGEKFSMNFWDNSGPESKGSRYRRVLEEADQESKTGVDFHYIIEVTTGRKAL
jgi:hypothetical protein